MTTPRPKTTFPTRRAVALGVGGAALAAATGAMLWPMGQAADYPPTTGEMQGFVLLKKPAPVPSEGFFDGDGQRHQFADFKGDVLLVNFWATWCAPCIKEMPSLSRLAASLKGERFRLLAVSQDREGKEKAEPFLRDRLGISNMELFYDPKLTLGREFGLKGLPTTYLIDATGGLIGGMTGGAEWDGPDAEALIRHVLPKSVDIEA